MANFIEYKGFKIEPCEAGFSVWGKSPFYPIDSRFVTSKSIRACKIYINDWLKTWKLKNWCTMFHDFIAKETITWPR